jgi:hypothetical protein
VKRLGLLIFLAACGGAGQPAATATAPAAAATPPPVTAAAPAVTATTDSAAPAGALAPQGDPAPPSNPAPPAPAPPATAPTEEEDETKILELEAIGPLRWNMTGAEMVKHLGAPQKKSKGSYEGATGAYASWWSWPGVGAGMVSDKPAGPWVARSIQVSAPRKLATKAGIRIGSTRKEVEAKYKRGSMDQGEPESFLVGSPYGGMYFWFKDGVVKEIGLGIFAF